MTGRRGGRRKLSDDYLPVGAILQRYRKEAQVDLDRLAEEAHLSTSLLSKIEAGHRQATKKTIVTLAPILKIPESDRKRLLWLADPYLPEMSQRPDGGRRPTPRELTVLDSNPFPACYMGPPMGLDGALHVIVATNAAFDRFFPGLEPGASTVDYELLHRTAKDVFVRWDEDAHHLVRACRAQLTGFVTETRIEEIKTKLRRNPDFDGMWDTPYPSKLESRDTVWVRDISDGAVFEMYFRVSWDDSPWLHYGLMPVDLASYLKRYPVESHRKQTGR
ncbi:MmyB family transcriptional regulator [Nocardia sp. Marseille-Q1738]